MESYHRHQNYWEPTYQPDIEVIETEYKWEELNNNIGPIKQKCDISKITDDSYSIEKIRGKTFDTCDFIDRNKAKPIIFSNCTFKLCYFGRSYWKNVKFQNCSFSQCSFSLTKFHQCQFIECSFSKISISGNETKFIECVINPELLINSAYTNLNKSVLEQKGNTVSYQRYRLEKTKSQIAKSLNLTNGSSSEFYYCSIKVATLQEVSARIEQCRYQISTLSLFYKIFKFPKLFLCYIEKNILKTLGWMNDWGGNLAKVIFLGIFIITIFFVIYSYQAFFMNIEINSKMLLNNFIKSCDVTFIVGYTKYFDSFAKNNLLINAILFINMLIGLLWYSVAIPTIINKLTKTRF